jgi:hypothetical protein
VNGNDEGSGAWRSSLKEKELERFAQAPGRLGRTARDNTNREHVRQGAPDER